MGVEKGNTVREGGIGLDVEVFGWTGYLVVLGNCVGGWGDMKEKDLMGVLV